MSEAAPFTFQFTENDDRVIAIVVNSELSRWSQITKYREGDTYRLIISYGSLGTGKNRYKANKLPQIYARTNAEATALANAGLSAKLSNGYAYETVTVNGENIYPRS